MLMIRYHTSFKKDCKKVDSIYFAEIITDSGKWIVGH